MKTAVFPQLGPSHTPQEVKDLRQSSLEFHRVHGQPLVHKHKWNEIDVREGRARLCPFHDDVYGRDRSWDQYCYGTGYVGGWADGDIFYGTVGDTQEDVFRQTESGVLVHQRHPGLSAPWLPILGDGDLIFTVDFIDGTLEIDEVIDRFTLREVTPTTMRGPAFNSFNGRPYRVSQESMMDRVLEGHPWFDVPVIFDYGNVPEPEFPPDYDPGDYPAGSKFSAHDTTIRVRGSEAPFGSSDYRIVKVAVTPVGEGNYMETVIKVGGNPGGAHVYLKPKSQVIL